MRHPASGYVQGINDIVTPFIVVFLSDYAEINL
jgi:TBC1 domain family member 2